MKNGYIIAAAQEERFTRKKHDQNFPSNAIKYRLEEAGISAGVSMITSLVSLITNIPVKSKVAMTGEITLRGNVLPIGGVKEKVTAAFKLILSDKNVKGILINIFGGIMRCDILAQGVVDAAKEINLSVPLVVRLAGTNFKEGKEILDKSNLKILSASDLNDAAKKIVEAIK